MFEFYREKLVAVTGGTSLNGSYIVKALAEAGARGRTVTDDRPPKEFTKLALERVVRT